MNHFKRHNSGFTFVEIVLTIALMGAVLTALFAIQFNVLRSISSASDQLSRIFLLKNVLHQTMLNPDEQKKPTELSVTKEISDPPTTVKFEVAAPGEKSLLKNVKDFYELRIHATWKRGAFENSETLLSFWYKPTTAEEKQ